MIAVETARRRSQVVEPVSLSRLSVPHVVLGATSIKMGELSVRCKVNAKVVEAKDEGIIGL